MRGTCLTASLSIAVFCCSLIAAPSARAQKAPERGWVFSGQLTSVWTGGNSESSTFGLGGTLRHIGEQGEFKIETGGIRTEASHKTRRAVGTPDDYQIEEDEQWVKTAEAYFGRARMDRKVGDGFIAFTGVDVLRNTFAGIDSRVLLAAGAGNMWVNTDNVRFKTDYGVTYTFQGDVVQNPFTKTSFPGARFSWDLRKVLTSTTRFESALVSDVNFSNADDIRLDMTNALPVSVSKALSLKPSFQMLWRNQPALKEIDLYTPAGDPTDESVNVPLEKLDTFFTLALVLTL